MSARSRANPWWGDRPIKDPAGREQLWAWAADRCSPLFYKGYQVIWDFPQGGFKVYERRRYGPEMLEAEK